MYFFDKGYAIIQLPEYLLSVFNYLKKNNTDLKYGKTAKSTVIVKPNDEIILHERVNHLESTVKTVESKLEEIIHLMSLK